MINAITDVSIIDDISLITLNIPANGHLMAEILSDIASNSINLDMISRTPPCNEQISVSLTVGDADIGEVVRIMGKYSVKSHGIRTNINSGNSKLRLYGEPMKEQPGVAAAAFRVLAQSGIGIKLVTTSDVDISILIDSKDADTAFNLFVK